MRGRGNRLHIWSERERERERVKQMDGKQEQQNTGEGKRSGAGCWKKILLVEYVMANSRGRECGRAKQFEGEACWQGRNGEEVREEGGMEGKWEEDGGEG